MCASLAQKTFRASKKASDLATDFLRKRCRWHTEPPTTMYYVRPCRYLDPKNGVTQYLHSFVRTLVPETPGLHLLVARRDDDGGAVTGTSLVGLASSFALGARPLGGGLLVHSSYNYRLVTSAGAVQRGFHLRQNHLRRNHLQRSRQAGRENELNVGGQGGGGEGTV